MKFECKNLSKIYKDKVVVKKFSYLFKSGLYLFEGINGAGKSTTMKMLAGVIKPSNLNYQISKVNLCYLPEKPALTNGKVLPFLNQIKSLNHKRSDVRKLMSLYKIPNKSMNSLSKGNKQKVAILMMFLTNAQVYLFDEPTDSLDQETIYLFIDGLKAILENNKIVIVITHEESYFKDLKKEVVLFANETD